MRLSKFLGGVAALAAVVAAAPASAVIISSSSLSGGNTIDPVELSSSQISLDFGIAAFTPITVNFGVQAGDVATYNFDSAIDIFTGVGAPATGVASLVLGLTNGATFNLGTVTPSFSNATTSLNAARNAVTINFAPAENFRVELGSLDSLLGDFGINRNNVFAGQNFALTIGAAPVPEPASWLMMIAGFGLVGYGMRRSARNAHGLKLA